jgi:hypothetical protein
MDVTTEIFMAWMEDHFLPRKPSGKVLFFLVGHSSHVSDTDIMEFANESDIVLLCLPSHSTYYLQPFDRSFFQVFKALLPCSLSDTDDV